MWRGLTLTVTAPIRISGSRYSSISKCLLITFCGGWAWAMVPCIEEESMWHKWMSYPKAVPLWAQRLLDEAEALMEDDMPTTTDRYRAMTQFLEEGPFTKEEIGRLRSVLGPHI